MENDLMDFIVDQAVMWWQITTVIILILIGWVINLFGVDQKEPIIGFEYEKMPAMRPIKIETAGKGFWGAIKLWLLGVRTWEIVEDFKFKMDGQEYVIPKGFVFDGASVPKFLATWLSPTGVLLAGGLVHDYLYKYQTLLLKGKKKCEPAFTRKEADKLFRDINIEQNGFHFLNYLAYWALCLGGWFAWNKHRKANFTIPQLKNSK